MRTYREWDRSQKQTNKKTLAKTTATLFCEHCGTAGHTQQEGEHSPHGEQPRGEQSDQTDFLTTHSIWFARRVMQFLLHSGKYV